MTSPVSVRLPKIKPTWRTVVVSLSIHADVKEFTEEDDRVVAVVRKWIREIAKRSRIPKKQAFVRGVYRHGEYRGYINVYAGRPKPGDVKLFKRVQQIATEVSTMTIYRIKSQDQIDRERNNYVLSLPSQNQ